MTITSRSACWSKEGADDERDGEQIGTALSNRVDVTDEEYFTTGEVDQRDGNQYQQESRADLTPISLVMHIVRENKGIE